MLKKNKVCITFLSNFSWSNQNVLELICETASFAKFKVNYFPKPLPIYKKRSDSELFCDLEGYNGFDLKILPYFTKNIPLVNKLQKILLHTYIIDKIDTTKENFLFYNNLDVVSIIRDNLRSSFSKLIYLCADYSELDERVLSNAEIADKIIVCLPTMQKLVESKFPNKTFLWPVPTSNEYSNIKSISSHRISTLLSQIPKPRVVYAGFKTNRVDENIYKSVANKMPEVSFVSFGSKNLTKNKNIYEAPWLEKHEMHSFLSECQAGFMPYDLSNPHNLHCIPLKLFDFLAEGLPVVSSKLINIQDFNSLIYFSETVEEYAFCLQKALHEDAKSELRKERKKRAQQHQTTNLTHKLDELLATLVI